MEQKLMNTVYAFLNQSVPETERALYFPVFFGPCSVGVQTLQLRTWANTGKLPLNWTSIRLIDEATLVDAVRTYMYSSSSSNNDRDSNSVKKRATVGGDTEAAVQLAAIYTRQTIPSDDKTMVLNNTLNRRFQATILQYDQELVSSNNKVVRLQQELKVERDLAVKNKNALPMSLMLRIARDPGRPSQIDAHIISRLLELSDVMGFDIRHAAQTMFEERVKILQNTSSKFKRILHDKKISSNISFTFSAALAAFPQLLEPITLPSNNLSVTDFFVRTSNSIRFILDVIARQNDGILTFETIRTAANFIDGTTAATPPQQQQIDNKAVRGDEDKDGVVQQQHQKIQKLEKMVTKHAQQIHQQNETINRREFELDQLRKLEIKQSGKQDSVHAKLLENIGQLKILLQSKEQELVQQVEIVKQMSQWEATTKEHVRQLEANLATKNAQLKALEQSKDQILAKQENEKYQLRTAATERIKHLESVLSERDARIYQLEVALADKDEKLKLIEAHCNSSRSIEKSVLEQSATEFLQQFTGEEEIPAGSEVQYFNMIQTTNDALIYSLAKEFHVDYAELMKLEKESLGATVGYFLVSKANEEYSKKMIDLLDDQDQRRTVKDGIEAIALVKRRIQYAYKCFDILKQPRDTEPGDWNSIFKRAMPDNVRQHLTLGSAVTDLLLADDEREAVDRIVSSQDATTFYRFVVLAFYRKTIAKSTSVCQLDTTLSTILNRGFDTFKRNAQNEIDYRQLPLYQIARQLGLAPEKRDEQLLTDLAILNAALFVGPVNVGTDFIERASATEQFFDVCVKS